MKGGTKHSSMLTVNLSYVGKLSPGSHCGLVADRITNNILTFKRKRKMKQYCEKHPKKMT